ncbi:MAG: Hpt domain-containing protein [Treponema sp.]|nr:Hpt domain-containing protein [Treponema sp.]
MTFDELLPAIIGDIPETLARFCDNKALLEKFIRKFPDDANFAKFKEIAETGDWAELEVTAHTLKGFVGNLGITKLYDLFTRIVNEYRASNNDAVKELIPQAVACGEEVIGLIKQLDN